MDFEGIGRHQLKAHFAFVVCVLPFTDIKRSQMSGSAKKKKKMTSSRSCQSIKIGIDLSIDKSIKIGKSDLIDIDCIDQSVEIDDTLVSFIDLSRKIHLFFCSSKNEN